MLYMRNRSGVVFQRSEGLLKDKTLGFQVCDMHGHDTPPEDTDTSEEVITTPKAPAPRRKARKKGK